MSHTPTRDLVDFLNTNIASLTSGTNLYDSQVRAPLTGVIPEDAVFVWATGGRAPERTMGEPDEVRRAIVHFRVRNQKNATGLALAREIQDTVRASSITGYIDVSLLIPEPRALGQDADGRNFYGGEFEMTYVSD